MVVKFKKGKLTADGMQVTDSQNDTVGIVVWAGAFGHNLNQVTSGGAVIPAIPATLVEDAIPVPKWGWVLITQDGVYGFATTEDLAADGWKTVES